MRWGEGREKADSDADSGPKEAPEPNWPTIRREILKILVGTQRARADEIGELEDATQDALLCMVVQAKGRQSQRINRFVAFGVAVARRRLIDNLRKRRRRREKQEAELDDETANPVDELGTTDWPALLRQAGWEPTKAWSRILTAIANGARGTRKIADTLGLDVKTVHESRRRLRRWLREKLKRPPSPPGDY